ncbi:HAD-superfamily hydrolase [Guyanagaster necrorhizus]|uniref:HAD-superfamily hydrolase n=1 Tax=Guyanagaster necrorhizus TaxID=856835 RepID=A0A9P7W090_9AGAR|nr:HAD-superfamily hydrolase [Guyanagaster necrorhizus MCA 3950]KAG7449594.1 HAD-superfamily hydrolase [Guyanagaster necrorhizus MCA 3950]
MSKRRTWGDRPDISFANTFAFDIDGVLIRGPHALPPAHRALQMLQGNNPFKKKIPFILLTNGGGVSESARAKGLSDKLGIQITPNQCVQAHTILQQQVSRYANEHVLVLGGRRDEIRQVAKLYGFNKAHTMLDVLAWNPAVWPFYELTPAERESTRPVDFSKTSVSAIFVFHDPRNWALDIQIICDVIQSNGIIGGPYGGPTKLVELVFCNPDLIWRCDFPRPRLGQGAFKEAFQAALTGKMYPHVQYGKPTETTYQFAKSVLENQIQLLYDNPESDIAGANGAGWPSVLVRTGVYDPVHGPPAHKPSHEAQDVEEAVLWAISKELER